MVFCNKDDCIYRSKQKCSSYTLGGKPAYKCKRKHIVIVPYCIGDLDTHIPTPNTCQCLQYQSTEEEEVDDDGKTF